MFGQIEMSNMVNMNWLILKVIILVMSVSMFTLSPTSAAKEIDIKVPIKVQQNIEIIAKQGVFTVSGWNKDFVSLNGEVKDDIRVEQSKSTVVLELNTANPLAAGDLLEIKVPSDRKINITSDHADFSLDKLTPKVTHETQSSKIDSSISVSSIDGNVRVENSSGDFSISTINGNITILDSSGIANIKSVSGHQNINSDLRNISSSNVSGQSSYVLRTLEKLNLSNVNGNSLVKSSISQGASVQMRSVKGHVELLVPDTTSARFSLQSHQGGTVSNMIGGTVDPHQNTSGAQIFTLADASANVTIDTLDGDITVAPQNATTTEYVDEDYDWSSVDTSVLNFAFINPKYNSLDYKEIYIKQPEIHFDPSW